MPLDNNTYYPSSDITIFPSSNAVDNGKLFTEYNGRNITINITKLNYIVSPNPGGYDLSLVNGKIQVEPGKAIINGFDVTTLKSISVDLPTSDKLYLGDKYKSKYEGFALLCLHTLFDSMENLSGNVKVSDVWYCEGITVCYPTAEEYEAHENEYLLLGGVALDGTIKENDEKYFRIDADDILIQVESDPETGAPPEQSASLTDFINNLLHGYWVSKLGDNVYGKLNFRDMPQNYLDPGFDYTTEAPLTDKTNYVSIDVDARNKRGHISIKDRQLSKSLELYPTGIYFTKDLSESLSPLHSQITAGVDDRLNITTYDYAGFSIRNDTYDTQYFVIDFSEEYGVNAYFTNDDEGVKNYLYDGSKQDLSIKTVFDTNNIYSLTSLSSKEIPEIQFFYRNINAGENRQATLQLNTQAFGNNTWRGLSLSGSDFYAHQNLLTDGYIVAGLKNQTTLPSEVTVPDLYNGGERRIKSGDIYTFGQVWCAVYNDIAEMFELTPEARQEAKPGLLVSIDNNGNYVIADRHNDCIVGVISENPALCVGVADSNENSVPVALAGRVNVMYEGKKPRVGDYVGLSKKTPGFVTKRRKNSKYCCGKVLRIIDSEKIEILVSL